MRMSLFRIVACAAFTVGTGLAAPAVGAAVVPAAALPAELPIATPAPTVQLPPAGSAGVAAGQPDVQLAQYYRRRYRRPRRGYRHRYRGWYYGRPWWRPAPRRRYRYGYRRGRGGGHVRWCLNRYRSYNPRTDSYLGYDGRYHRCRSPYR